MKRTTVSERALVLAPRGRDAAIAVTLLQEAGISADVCASLADLIGELDRGAGFVIVTEEVLGTAGLAPLAAWMADQQEWSDLPVVLLTSQGGGLERNPTARRYLDVLGNVTFLERPFHPTTLISLARSALRARRRQYEARARLDALRDSQERYRTLFETIDEGFCVIEFLDGPHGPLSDYVHVEANPAFAVHAGIPDVVGRRVRDMVPDEAEGWVEIYSHVLQTGEPVRFERELVATRRHLEIAAFRVEPASRRQVAVLFQDITARKRAEERLRAINADLERQVIERSHERGRTWQVSTELLGVANADGFFFSTNPAWGRTLGWTEDEVAHTPLFELVHADDVERTRAAFEELRRGNPVLKFENRYRRKDGAYRWISWVAVPEGDKFYCIGRDVTASIEQEAELAARTAERDRLWTLSQDMLARADYEGMISAVSPAWTRVLGWSESELLTRPYASFMHPEDMEPTLAALARMGETGLPTRFENRIATKDGAWRPIEWTVAPEPDSPNFIAVGRDLSAVRAQEAELLQAQEALRQSQKMEAVGQLTGGLAHDFNNLLAGISGSLELMAMRIAQDRLEDVDRYLVAAQGAARRAAALTHRLLAFSRRQTLAPKVTDVNALVAGMEELIRRTVEPAVKVETATGSGVWPVEVDPNQLENALLNLAINARDAMPDGGTLTIETANRWMDARAAREQELSPGQYVSLSVSDTGTGMAPEVVARAFDPFFTTKPIGVGTGLGLSMVYGFARQSGGQVRIRSEIGQGTTVRLYLPRHIGGEDAEEAPSKDETAAPSGTGETVLVIDDEAVVRMLIVDVLEELGYAVLEASDGPGGLDVLQSKARVDLLITDVGLPGGLNGRQVADAARTLRPELKVLFVTGYAENAVLGHGHLGPGMQVITKPFAVEELARRIRDILSDR